jgi:hypothetical protein
VAGKMIHLGDSSTAPYEMQNEENQTHDKQEVNQTRADVKCKKPKQPENNQYQSD